MQTNEDLALNNPQGLICHKIQLNQHVHVSFKRSKLSVFKKGMLIVLYLAE